MLKMNGIMRDSVSNPNITPTLKMSFVDRLHLSIEYSEKSISFIKINVLNKTILQISYFVTLRKERGKDIDVGRHLYPLDIVMVTSQPTPLLSYRDVSSLTALNYHYIYVVICIAGNKCDKAGASRDIESFEEYARSVNGTFFLTSALTGIGIQEIFENLSKNVYEAHQANRRNNADLDRIRLGAAAPVEEAKKGCC